MLLNESFLARALGIVSLCKEEEEEEEGEVKVHCLRACACSEAYADMLTISIKHGECWVHVRTTLSMAAK